MTATLMLLGRVGFGQISYSITDLGSGQANAINASGQVVGQNGNDDILLYSNGAVQDLGNGDGLGINDSGQIVGYDNASGSNYSAFIDTNGSFQTIGSNKYEAIGINDSGVVVGDVNHGFKLVFTRMARFRTSSPAQLTQSIMMGRSLGLMLMVTPFCTRMVRSKI